MILLLLMIAEISQQVQPDEGKKLFSIEINFLFSVFSLYMANATENSFGVQVSKASEISQKVQPDERKKLISIEIDFLLPIFSHFI